MALVAIAVHLLCFHLKRHLGGSINKTAHRKGLSDSRSFLGEGRSPDLARQTPGTSSKPWIEARRAALPDRFRWAGRHRSA